MKYLAVLLCLLFLASCPKGTTDRDGHNIIFLSHSTGSNLFTQGDVPGWFERYNKETGRDFHIERIDFPEAAPYGWENYPFDFWNIWVKHNGYKLNPSLEKLSRKYDLVIWKHCFPGSMIEPDLSSPAVGDRRKSIAAYKLQYEELKRAMKRQSDTKFLVWTLAVMREEDITEEQAVRTKAFVDWVVNEWDEPGDNIYIWDFYRHETLSNDGKDQSLYLRPEFATEDAHPNGEFNRNVAPEFCERIVEVLEGNI